MPQNELSGVQAPMHRTREITCTAPNCSSINPNSSRGYPMSCTDNSLWQQIGASGCLWEFNKVWNPLDRTMLPQTSSSGASKTMGLIYKSGGENTAPFCSCQICSELRKHTWGGDNAFLGFFSLLQTLEFYYFFF